jgi:hypothetical protein
MSIMKKFSLSGLLIVFLLAGIVISCKKSEYTIEDQPVSGAMSYVRTNFVPFEFDPLTQQPLKANITMEGTGSVEDIGELHMVSNFKADLVTGIGYDFETVYTGDTPSDSFTGQATAERLQDGSLRLTQSIFGGSGKYSKINGSGEEIITLNADQSEGAGVISWTITF